MKRQVKKNNSFEKLSSDDDDEKVDAEPTKKPMRKIKKKIRIFQNKFNIDDENMLKFSELIIEGDKIMKKNKEKKEKEKREEKREEKRQKKNQPIIKNLKHKNHTLREENKGLKKTVEHLKQQLRQQQEEQMRREKIREEKRRQRQEEQRKQREEEEQRRRTKKAKNKKSNFPKDINDFENNPTKQQWYALSKKYHPDKGGSKQFMQKINDIWAEHKIRYDSN